MIVTRSLRSAVVIGYMLSITWIRRNLLSLVWLFATPFSILFIVTVTTRGQAFVQGAIRLSDLCRDRRRNWTGR